MAMLDVIGILDIYNNPILMWFYYSNNAMIGKGSHVTFYYLIFFKTSPLLFLSLFYCLKNKKYFSALINCIAIFFSGTRANVFILVACLIFYFIFLQPNKTFRHISIILCIFALVYILIDRSIINYIVDIFERKSSSDLVRNGHLLGIFKYWSTNQLNFLVGSGFSSEFYSYGVGEYVSNIELSYWNLLRQVGLLPFIVIFCIYLYPLVSLSKDKNNYWIIISYVAYLIIAYTNPFLYSSTGVTLLLFLYFKMFSIKNNNWK
jgi:hypothetical protein